MEFYDCTNFSIEGEFGRIFHSLGLFSPKDFSIPAVAWEVMKLHSSSDILRCHHNPAAQQGEHAGDEDRSIIVPRVNFSVLIIDLNKLVSVDCVVKTYSSA
ncbi:hypothetical protein Fmac_028452 [Flemingia macrophylla]|uniref:Uncharacterized protein n=1 Tax=Flemingia macrophylla TaxID=520843 RepID=A0ABD1L7J5_9FABA